MTILNSDSDFKECAECSKKPGSPILCNGCQHNRRVIAALRASLASPRFTLEGFRAANLSRLSRFGHGGLRDTAEAWSPMQWGCALAGEVGELCNVLKKYERQMPSDPKPDDLYGAVCEEIADVLTYLDLLAAWFDIDLARVTILKFNKVSQRAGFPERL